MANCSDNTYSVRHTDKNKTAYTVGKSALITDKLDIALVGKTRLEYGKIFNENVLHILENFSCPESSATPGTPDFTKAYSELLERPVEGQFWYNNTQQRPYVYSGSVWVPLGTLDDVAGNSGSLMHGQFLPRPVSSVSGYEFEYPECCWTVSPLAFDGDVDYMVCYTNPVDSQITMQYRLRGESSLRNGSVNYQIIGIKSNTNLGTIEYPPPPPSPSPQPTPTISNAVSTTPAPGSSLTPTPTPQPTPTPSPINSFTANMFAFEGANIRAYSVTNGGASSISLWDFNSANPSDTDTIPLSIWVNEDGVSKYVAALYNRYLRLFTWNGSVLTQVAKVAMNCHSAANYVDYGPAMILPEDVTSFANGISLRAVDFGTYYIFFVGNVGTVPSSIDIGKTYEVTLQNFKFVKSGNVLTSNLNSLTNRFRQAVFFPSAKYDRQSSVYDIRIVGSNIKAAVTSTNKDILFQYDSNGSWSGVLGDMGTGTSGGVPTNTMMWYDNTRYFRGKDRDLADDTPVDYVKFFNQATTSGTSVTGLLEKGASLWGEASATQFYFTETYFITSTTYADRIVALSADTSTSLYADPIALQAVVKKLNFSGNVIFADSGSTKVATKASKDYLAFRTNKSDTNSGSVTLNGMAFYSFNGTTFTYEVGIPSLSPTAFTFYIL